MIRTLAIITSVSVAVGLLAGLLVSPTQAVGIGAAALLSGWTVVCMSGVGFPESLYPAIYRDEEDL